jgi:hypothetical protein
MIYFIYRAEEFTFEKTAELIAPENCDELKIDLFELPIHGFDILDLMPCCVVMILLIGIFFLSITLFIQGLIAYLRLDHPQRLKGMAKMVSGLLLAAVVIGSPQIAFFSHFGRLPSSPRHYGKLLIGTPKATVLELFGRPMQSTEDFWIYWFDSWQSDGVAITFDEQGCIVGLHRLPS